MTAGSAVVIVGAGITGLTVAEQLTGAGLHVVVLDRETETGGLARTFSYDGYRFDIGPHRFHTYDDRINQYIRLILADRAVEIGRRSSVFFQNRYFTWPLQHDALFKLPPFVALQCAADLLLKPFRPVRRSDTFEDYVINQYGPTLYRLFFKQYTEKFAYVSCGRLHHSWASASVARAIIDERIKMDNIWHVLRNVVFPPRVTTRFIYPDTGTGAFCDSQAERVRAAGGVIHTSVDAIRLVRESNRITALECSAGRFPVSTLVWTAPLPVVCGLLEMPVPQLNYMNTALFNVTLNRPAVQNDQWIYFSSRNIVFARTSNPAAFHAGNVPPGKGALCVEVMCHEPDWWDRPERLTDRVLKDLRHTGLIRNGDVADVHIEKIPETYPIYTLEYPAERAAALEQLQGIANLIPTGRCGAFVYNNMDDSIRMGLDAARSVLTPTS